MTKVCPFSSCITTVFKVYQYNTVPDLSHQAIGVAILSYPKLPLSESDLKDLKEQGDFSLEVEPNPPQKDIPHTIVIRHKGVIVARCMSFDPNRFLYTVVDDKAYLLVFTRFEGTLQLVNAS